MLRLLTDEQIAPIIASQVRSVRPDIAVLGLREWRDGTLQGEPDGRVLEEAYTEGLTLVTYDARTIPPLLSEWAAEGKSHAGVLFVDDRSIRQGDVGGFLRALVALWDQTQDWEWMGRVGYLAPARTAEP